MKTIYNLVIVIISGVLFSCGLAYIGLIITGKKEASIPQIINIKPSALNLLETRKERWVNAEKCLKAMDAVNGRVETLCNSSQDIYLLAKEIGTTWADLIVKEHLKAIGYYEKQLKEEIIDKLPSDEPMTFQARWKLIEDNSKAVKEKIYLVSLKRKTCVYRADIGEVNYENCIGEVDKEYAIFKENQESTYKKIINALDQFDKNYRFNE